MGIVTKAAACSAVLVAMVIAGVLSYRPVVQFHQYPGIQRQQAHFKPEHPEDRGYAKNCGQGGPAYFNVSWSPKQISPMRQVILYVNVVSPVYFDNGQSQYISHWIAMFCNCTAVDFDNAVYFEKGKVSASVWYEGNIMVNIKKEIRCEEIAQVLAHILPPHSIDLTCPLKKGQLLTGQYVYSDTEHVIGYDGHYRLKAQLWNDQGEELLCIEIEVDVLPFQ